MVQNLISILFIGAAIVVLGFFEMIVFSPEISRRKEIVAMLHFIVYAAAGYWCLGLLGAPQQQAVVGIKVVLYLSLVVSTASALFLFSYYGGFLLIGRWRWFRGCFNALRGQKLLYSIVYEDGTVSDIVSNKAKKGILWPHDGKNYLIALYDKNVSVNKAPIQNEKLLLAAAKDVQLQASIAAAGGRPIGSGVYFCIGKPGLAEDGTCAVQLKRNGKIGEYFLFEEDVLRGLIREIRLYA